MPPDREPKDRATVLAENRTELANLRTTLAESRSNQATMRTKMAADRSLMAWIRTSLSMIGFGFSIFKFFQYMPGEVASGVVRRPNAPRNLGLTLIALGTLALVAASWQHLHLLDAIEGHQKRHLLSTTFVAAMIVVVIGIITFYGALLRHGPF